MLKEKKSFFERLAGSISVEDEDDVVDFTPQQEDEQDEEVPIKHVGMKQAMNSSNSSNSSNTSPLSRQKVTHVIEEDEGADAAALHGRQRASHREATEVARPRFDDELDRCGRGIDARGLVGVECSAHGGPASSGAVSMITSDVVISL